MFAVGQKRRFVDASLTNRNRDPQEGRRNGGGSLACALVLAIEQNFQLLLQIAGTAVLFRGFERVHGRSIVLSEFIDELGRRAGKVEKIGVPEE